MTTVRETNKTILSSYFWDQTVLNYQERYGNLCIPIESHKQCIDSILRLTTNESKNSISIPPIDKKLIPKKPKLEHNNNNNNNNNKRFAKKVNISELDEVDKPLVDKRCAVLVAFLMSTNNSQNPENYIEEIKSKLGTDDFDGKLDTNKVEDQSYTLFSLFSKTDLNQLEGILKKFYHCMEKYVAHSELQHDPLKLSQKRLIPNNTNSDIAGLIFSSIIYNVPWMDSCKAKGSEDITFRKGNESKLETRKGFSLQAKVGVDVMENTIIIRIPINDIKSTKITENICEENINQLKYTKDPWKLYERNEDGEMTKVKTLTCRDYCWVKTNRYYLTIAMPCCNTDDHSFINNSLQDVVNQNRAGIVVDYNSGSRYFRGSSEEDKLLFNKTPTKLDTLKAYTHKTLNQSLLEEFLKKSMKLPLLTKEVYLHVPNITGDFLHSISTHEIPNLELESFHANQLGSFDNILIWHKMRLDEGGFCNVCNKKAAIDTTTANNTNARTLRNTGGRPTINQPFHHLYIDRGFAYSISLDGDIIVCGIFNGE